MRELIFNILIFTIVTSVLKCLIIKDEYKQYFQFFCGLIMILIVMTPVIKFFGAGNDFYNILSEHIYNSEFKDSVGELKSAEGSLKKQVVRQCEEKIEKQVRQMAEKNNVACSSVKIKTKTSGDELEIVSVVVNTGSSAVAAYSNTAKKSSGLTKNERRLKKDICDNYLLKGEEVQIWK
ncbi:stage III sporulation protein AF [Eubacterium sp. MSJ-13]|uniref:stage III sporulation protein AF n=1 Tax=Eubacterium sp. MSJ-13 TaxID=2841513 RepID=UPI001C10CCEF|nr:stage III sporulation protein AF [Eubacterium sp. MSJ-13]MBU5479244.1 stage III sporulation protein AF [Eubacterium sp. MSJ-13]